MGVPHREELATHADSESCAVAGNGIGETLTGVRAGWVLSLERNVKHPGADAVLVSGRQHRGHRYREVCADPAGSETPCMHGSSLYGMREIPRLALLDRSEVRTKNPKGVRS
jgi:hypothetical protein